MSTNEEIRELTPDTGTPTQAHIAYQIIDTLEKNEEAAYRVYIILSKKFGAGQRILS